jgi:hypothetical protein
MTNKNLLIAGGVILAVGGIGYIYRNEIMNLFIKDPIIPIGPENNPIIPIGPEKPSGNVAPYVAPSEPAWVPRATRDIDAKLKKGMKDENVKLLQYNIREIQNINGIYPLIEADGDFGSETQKMLLKISDFYKKNGYWTVRRARETMARYAGKKKKPFPKYLESVSNVKDLKKIYEANIVNKILDGTFFQN